MARFYVPTRDVNCWQAGLADPRKHWRSGFSARTLAHDWEEAGGLPDAVAQALEVSFGVRPELLFAIPEHKVALPGGARDSQTDLFALLGIGDETAAMAVEGKVDEAFGPTLTEWGPASSPGKTERFRAITTMFGLKFDLDGDLRYQLFHRTASAILEARRFRCGRAIMIVQSYSPRQLWFEDYERFIALFGLSARKGQLAEIILPEGMPLHFGWVAGNQTMLAR